MKQIFGLLLLLAFPHQGESFSFSSLAVSSRQGPLPLRSMQADYKDDDTKIDGKLALENDKMEDHQDASNMSASTSYQDINIIFNNSFRH